MMNRLPFIVIKNNANNFYGRAIRLYWDKWNDFGYRTQFNVRYFNGENEKMLGYVKVAFSEECKKQLGIIETENNTFIAYNDYLPEGPFQQLPEGFFSLGDISYYENIRDLLPEEREDIYIRLNDLAFNLELFDELKKKNIEVLKISLLRDFYDEEIKNQLHRIATGGISKIDFCISHMVDFSFIEFKVKPNSLPSTNIHAIIGTNGVGKTYLLKELYHKTLNSIGKSDLLKVIYISFSPFENDAVIQNSPNFIGFSSKNFLENYSQHNSIYEEYSPSIESFWANRFSNELISCRKSIEKRKRWEKIAEFLQSDPIFYEVKIMNLIDFLSHTSSKIAQTENTDKEFREKSESFFNKLSSGHKIILYTITSLCNQVIEKTLVLYDEPELFLHPPLLSSFINAINWLMDDRNGIAILATHSPIVLQELPKKCIWKVLESSEDKFTRLSDETYGENFSTLNKVIFDVQLKDSGFYRTINEIIIENSRELESLSSLEERFEYICNKFNGELGSEAKTLILTKLKNKVWHEEN